MLSDPHISHSAKCVFMYKRYMQGGANCCPLRRLGSGPSHAHKNMDLDPKSLLSFYHDRLESIEKIKREYHIKEECGQDNDNYKDVAIKAESGHHDKISLGLFPSDVKSSFLSPTVKIEREEGLRTVTATAIETVADTVYMYIKAERAVLVKEEKLSCESLISVNSSTGSRRSERRVLLCSKEVKVESKKRNHMEDQNDEISCIKRR